MRTKAEPAHVAKKRGTDETTAAPGVDLRSVQRFVRTVPGLRRLLASPATCDRERLLRAEMRQTIAMLAETLGDAARAERRTPRGSVYHAAAIVAADLAATAATAADPTTRHH